MKRSKRLQSVITLVQMTEQDSARKLAKTGQELTESERKLEALKASRLEYSQRFEAQSKTSISVPEIKMFHLFLQRLDEAITQLQAQCQVRQQVNEQSKQVWLQSRNKSRVLDNIAERYRKEEASSEQRREQDEMDDRAQRVPK
jgi:flagellar FliJ protein